MNARSTERVLRRLLAADGYLELNLPQYALDELESIGDAGMFEAEMHFLRGEAYKSQKRYGDAIAPLQEAARLLPDPHYRQAWLSLSECYRKRGQTDLAEVAEIAARADAAPTGPSSSLFALQVTINVQNPPNGTRPLPGIE
jgi:tetratricopeptide (TPR) repeat protein